MKRLAVEALSWVAVKALFRLGFLTNGDPEHRHLNKHVWGAVAAASTMQCSGGRCHLDEAAFREVQLLVAIEMAEQVMGARAQ